MTNESCDSLADLLVDYADRELSQAQAVLIEDHLAHCSACRENLQRLERSLDLARAVWQEAAARPVTIRRPVRRSGTLAACAAGLLVIAGFLYVAREQRPRPDHGTLEAVTDTAETVDFEIVLAREVQAARLAVSAEFLASHSATAPYDRDALVYLASTYPDTEPGRQAARRTHLSTEHSP